MERIIDTGIFFFIYALLGWITEVGYAFYINRRFVNRGFINGPLCPMYGLGMVLMIVMLEPFRHNWLLMFIGSVLITSALEMFTGWLLETVFKTKWWDYSDKKFNIKGYICLSFSLIWGVGAMAIVLFVQPALGVIVDKIPQFIRNWIVGGLSVLFAADVVVSVITALHLKDRLREMQAVLIDLAKGVEIKSLEGIRSIVKDDLFGTGSDMERRYENLRKHVSRPQIRLLNAFPRASTKRFSNALGDLRIQAGYRRHVNTKVGRQKK